MWAGEIGKGSHSGGGVKGVDQQDDNSNRTQSLHPEHAIDRISEYSLLFPSLRMAISSLDTICTLSFHPQLMNSYT